MPRVRLTSSKRLLASAVAALALIVGSLGAGSAAAAPPGDPQVAPPGQWTDLTAGELTVRGSVEQIYVVHAAAGVRVDVRGPRGFRAGGTTDANGASSSAMFRRAAATRLPSTATRAGSQSRCSARPSTRSNASTTVSTWTRARDT